MTQSEQFSAAVTVFVFHVWMWLGDESWVPIIDELYRRARHLERTSAAELEE